MVHYYCNNIWVNTFFNNNNLSKNEINGRTKKSDP